MSKQSLSLSKDKAANLQKELFKKRKTKTYAIDLLEQLSGQFRVQIGKNICDTTIMLCLICAEISKSMMKHMIFKIRA